MEHYLRGGPGIFGRIVMPERYAQVSCNVRQVPAPAPVSFRPGTAGNQGAVQPGRTDGLEAVPDHCAVEGRPVKPGVADQRPAFQQAAQPGLQLRQGGAVLCRIFANSVNADIHGAERLFRVDQE